ncbi:hypothetical protein BJ742DRAFT_787821 [Cladochytrium replicatum]|nr:hypothetical protein BJ742DRAFT_787821 [Cladochytrium replicatum]
MSAPSSSNGLVTAADRDKVTSAPVGDLADADLSLFYKSSLTPSPPAVTGSPDCLSDRADSLRTKDWLATTFASLATANSVEPPEERNRRATETILSKTDVVKVSQDLQARLSYARYKVEHGWQTKPLPEVRKLYNEQQTINGVAGSENIGPSEADQHISAGINGEREENNKRRKTSVMMFEGYTGDYDEERILAAQTILALSGHNVIMEHRPPPRTSQPDTPRMMNPSAPDVVDAAIGLLQAGGNLYNSQQASVRSMPNLPTPQPSPPQAQLNGGSQSASSIGTPPEQHVSLPTQQQAQQSTQQDTSDALRTNEINKMQRDAEVSSSAKGKSVGKTQRRSHDSLGPSKQRGRKTSQNDSSGIVPSHRGGQSSQSNQQRGSTASQPETTPTIQAASPREPASASAGKGKAANIVLATTATSSSSSSLPAPAYRMELQTPTLYQALPPSTQRVRHPQEQFSLGGRTFIPSSQPLGISPQPHHIIYTDDPYGVAARPGYTLEVDYSIPGHPQLLRGTGPPMPPHYITEIPIYHGGPSTTTGAPTTIGYTLARPHWQPHDMQQNIHRRLSGMEQPYTYSVAPPMVPHSYMTGGPNAPILIRIPATTTIQTTSARPLSAQAWSGIPQVTRRLSDPNGQMHLREDGQVFVGSSTGVRSAGMYPPQTTRLIPSTQEGAGYDLQGGSSSKIFLYEGSTSGNGTAPGSGGDN